MSQSYFDTLQGFMNNKEDLLQHAQDVGSEFANERAKTISDKFDSVTGDIEKWGNALQGASGGWWMGRKIIRKVRSYTPGEQEKGVSQGGDAGEFSEAERKAGNLQEDGIEDGAMKFGEKPQVDPENPFDSTPKTRPKSVTEEPEGDTPDIQETSFNEPGTAAAPADSAAAPVAESAVTPAVESAVAPAVESAVASSTPMSMEQVAALTQPSEFADAYIADAGAKAARRARKGLDEPDPNAPGAKPPTQEPPPAQEPAPTTETPTAEPPGSSGGDADALNDVKPVTNDLVDDTADLALKSTKPIIDDATKTIVSNVVEKTGVKTGLDIAGETLADAIPVVGEVVAIGTMLGGLFRDAFGKGGEKRKMAAAASAGLSQGISAQGGIDTSAIASRVGQVAGLV